ncbi:MAG: hypothetical protein AAGU14_11975 [Eubacteriaceae bacterium]
MESYFHDQDFIFREVLTLEQNDIKKMRNSPEEVYKLFNVKLKVNNEEILPKDFKVYDSGFIIYYKIKQEIEMKFDISCNNPQNIKRNYYSAYICEPTYKPQIKFMAPDNSTNVNTVFFFDEYININNAKSEVGEITEIVLPGWVTPRSGVVFAWESKKAD